MSSAAVRKIMLSISIQQTSRTLVVGIAGTSVATNDAGIRPCIFRVQEDEWEYLTALANMSPSESTFDTSTQLAAPVEVSYRDIIAHSKILAINPGGCVVNLIHQIEDLSFLNRLRDFSYECLTPVLSSDNEAMDTTHDQDKLDNVELCCSE
jgi:hypothetical protein